MKTFTLTAVALYLSTSVHAATERDLDSHVHGGARLDIAIDGQQIFLDFESPWINLVGFEHEPSNDEQRAAVAAVIEQLEQAQGLFTFSGAACVLADSSVESSMGDHEEHEAAASHSAVIASYVFDCADMDDLVSLAVGLFDVWPGIEDIDVQLAGPAGQTAVEIDSGNASLSVDDLL